MDSDAWGPPPAPVAAAPAGTKKRKTVVGGKEEDWADIMAVVVKMVLANTNDLKAVKSCVMRQFLIPTSVGFCAMSKAATKAYSENTKGKKGHKMGSPDVHVWRALVQWLQAEVKKLADAGDGSAAPVVKLVEDHAPHCTPDALKAHIHHLRLVECWKEDVMRLEVGISPDVKPVLDAAVKIMVAAGAEERFGKQPKGDLERKLLKYVSELKQ